MKRAILLFGLLFLAGPLMAASLPTPTASLSKFEVAAVSLRDITFLFELSVRNPYPVNLSFAGMTLVFSVEGAQVFTAASQGGFTVPASGSKSNQFTVKLAYQDIEKVVKEYTSKDYLNTVINGTLDIPLPRIPGLPKSYSFSYKLEKKIPAIKPQLAVKDFTVVPPTQDQVKAALAQAGKKVDPGKALGALTSVLQGKKPAAPVIDPADIDVPVSVRFTIELDNAAKAELSFAKLGYKLFVNGDSLVSGESTSVEHKSLGVSLITVTNTFSSRSLTANVRDMLTQRKGTFRLVGTAAIKLPDEIRKDPVPLEFDESSTFAMQ